MARRVELSDNSTYGAGTLVEQTEVAWADTEITVTIVQGALVAGSLFLFVTNADELTSDGFPVILEEPTPPEPPGPEFGAVGNLANASVQMRLEQIYASVAGHTAPSIARDTHFLMSRIGRELGIDITSGMRSFETNLRILYKALTGNTYTGDIHSTELILRAIEAEL